MDFAVTLGGLLTFTGHRRTAIDKVRGVLGGGTESRKEMDREWERVGVFGVIGPDADNGSPARISGCRLRGAD